MKTESLKMITRMKFPYSFKDEKSSVYKTDLQDKCDTITHWGSFLAPQWNSKYLANNPISSKFQVAKIRFQENSITHLQKKCKSKLSRWNLVVKGKGLSSVISVSKETRWPLNARELIGSLAQCYLCTFVCLRLFVFGSPNQFICMLVMFKIVFFSRNDLTIFYDFWYPSSFR